MVILWSRATGEAALEIVTIDLTLKVDNLASLNSATVVKGQSSYRYIGNSIYHLKGLYLYAIHNVFAPESMDYIFVFPIKKSVL